MLPALAGRIVMFSAYKSTQSKFLIQRPELDAVNDTLNIPKSLAFTLAYLTSVTNMSAQIITRTYPALGAAAIAAVRRSGSATSITRGSNINSKQFSSTAPTASSTQPSAMATGGAAPAAFWRRPRVWAVVGAVAAVDAVLYWEYRGSRVSAATPSETQ
jgi:hypothetical protein